MEQEAVERCLLDMTRLPQSHIHSSSRDLQRPSNFSIDGMDDSRPQPS